MKCRHNQRGPLAISPETLLRPGWLLHRDSPVGSGSPPGVPLSQVFHCRSHVLRNGKNPRRAVKTVDSAFLPCQRATSAVGFGRSQSKSW